MCGRKKEISFDIVLELIEGSSRKYRKYIKAVFNDCKKRVEQAIYNSRYQFEFVVFMIEGR